MAKKTTVCVKKTAAGRKPSRRAIGRPAASAEGVGREGLIETTCQLLQELPPNLVTRAEVARRANVDPSLIRYYFQDRSSLLVAATERITHKYSRSLAKAAMRAGPSAESRLRARIYAIIELITTFPFFLRLFIEELNGSAATAGDKLFRATVLEGVNDLRQVVDDGILSGELKPTNVPFLFVSLLGMAECFVTSAPLLKIAAGGRFEPAAATKRYKVFVADTMVEGLRARA